MEDKIKKLYKLLDLEHGASIENVKKAFRELSHIWHPDNHFKKSESVQARAEEKFKEISQAYQELKEHLDKEDWSVQEEREAEETRKSKEEEARQEEKARQEREEERRVEEQRKRKQEERAREERERKERAYREEIVNKSYEVTPKKADGWHWVFYIIYIFPLLFFLLLIIVSLAPNDQASIDKPINSANKYQTRKVIPDQGTELKISDLPEKATREQSQAYPNTRALQEAGAAFALGNYQEAMGLFMPLAKQGNPLAQASLGMVYYKGHGVPLSYQEAIKWTRKAAEQGYSLAQFDLGVMYDKGHGVPQDYQMAIKWWTKAAEQNHPFAQYNLGLTYAKHLSVPDDLITAYKWANMAATNHYEEAKKLLNMLRKNMTHAQIAEAQSLSEELIKKARSK